MTLLRHRSLALALAAGLLASACQTAPSAAPSGSAAPVATPPASTAPVGLAETLRDAIDVDDIVADLRELQAIADANGGVRAAGSAGHDASAEFVAGELRAAGFEVELQPVNLAAFAQLAPSVIEIQSTGAPVLEDIRDFKAMLYSGSGDATGKVFPLGFDPTAEPADRTGIGCEATDWASVPTGAIALVQPGPCRRYDVVQQAQAHGAVALITSYADWAPGNVLRPTLVEPAGITIPVIGMTHQAGLALAQAAQDGSTVHVATSTSIEHVTSMNVVAETPGGDPGRVLMVGGHLDSVVDGPGINDNGSGTMTVLEIARELAALAAAPAGGDPAWKVRVAFWTGEEIFLLGSFAYVEELDTTATAAIQAYLNFDMLGSTNGIRVIYDGQATSNPTEGSIVAGLFSQALDAEGLAWEPEAIGAASDHFPFDQAGIAIGGLFSGANEHKTPSQATEYGGTADAADDPCYHLACDTVENIDPAWLEQLARAAAWVVGRLASGEVVLAPS